jgi:quinol monooxygenase YgiN
MWAIVIRTALVVFCMTPVAYGQTTAPGRLMIVVEFEVKPDHRDEFIEVIKALGQRSRAEDGCQEFDVMLPNNDPKHVLVVEKWRDAAAHDAHLGPNPTFVSPGAK